MSDTARRTTVLHVLGELRPSGMERMLVSASDDFRAEGIDGVVLGQGISNPFASELIAAEYVVLESDGSLLERYRAMRRSVVEHKVSVIHIHTEGKYLPTAIAAKLALRGNGLIVRTIHNVFVATGRWRISRSVQARIADALMAEVVVPSADVLANELALGRTPVTIMNWVDRRFFEIREQKLADSGEPHEIPVALIVGNCSPIKNHELALSAVHSLGHNLIHVGDESHASQTESALLNEMESDGSLLLRGVMTPDLALLRSDYFLMSSTNEGMPVALAEALVVGLPAFVSDAPGLRWANSLGGVTSLDLHSRAWESSISNWQYKSPKNQPLAVDFSPSRGASQYAEIYRRGTARKSPKRSDRGTA